MKRDWPAYVLTPLFAGVVLFLLVWASNDAPGGYMTSDVRTDGIEKPKRNPFLWGAAASCATAGLLGIGCLADWVMNPKARKLRGDNERN